MANHDKIEDSSLKENQMESFIRNNLHLSDRQIAEKWMGETGEHMTKRMVLKRRQKWGIERDASQTSVNAHPTLTPEEAVAKDKTVKRLSENERVTKKKYKLILEENERLEELVQGVHELSAQKTQIVIKPKSKSGGEATMFAVASDWHIEEEVTLDQTSGLSEYDLNISKSRSEQFFQVALHLTEIERQHTDVNTLVVCLLGDFISSDIHEDTSKSALLEPIHAIKRCREYLDAGIRYLLENSDLNLKFVCHSGNHGRKDKGQLIANEAGNSLEYLMYHFLASDFRNEKRVEFMIPEGYHSYMRLYDNYTVRFHHGHAIRYGGGVGGITIPVNKAISAWNDGRKADLDVFGHFHQAFDGQNFICNGSMIGYSAYGLFVKGRYQRPQQMFFGIHNEHGKFVTRPILFE